MIRVIMIDGDTLFKDDRVFPHVPEALEIISKFETQGKPSLVLSLVSNYEMPLDELGLKRFFEPVEQRVTLSTQAGVLIPDARFFKKAIQRLRLRIGLDACLFVGNDAKRVKACSRLGMMALRFSEWTEMPLLIARLVNPTSNLNMSLALQLPLATTYDVQLVRLTDAQSGDVIHGIGKKFFPVPMKRRRGARETIEVPFTVQVDVSLDKQGRIRDVRTDQPTAEAIAESADYVETLEVNKQISHSEGSVKGGETHEVKIDDKGRKVLTRKRFIAS